MSTNQYLLFTRAKDGISYTITANKANPSIPFGYLSPLDDGYYHWFPIDFKGACLSENILNEINNKLHELNKEHHKKIQEYFENNK